MWRSAIIGGALAVLTLPAVAMVLVGLLVLAAQGVATWLLVTGAALVAAARDAGFRDRRRATMQVGAEAQKRFLLTRRDELDALDPARASDTMFELVVATLDHELLYGRFTTTSPSTDRELIEDLTRRSLAVLGARPVDETAVVAAGI